MSSYLQIRCHVFYLLPLGFFFQAPGVVRLSDLREHSCVGHMRLKLLSKRNESELCKGSVLWHTVWRYSMTCNAVRYNAVQCSIVQCNALLHHATQGSSVHLPTPSSFQEDAYGPRVSFISNEYTNFNNSLWSILLNVPSRKDFFACPKGKYIGMIS